MSLFVEQLVYCPACGSSHLAAISMQQVGSLCCSSDCRRAMHTANARYILGKPAPEGRTPYAALIISEISQNKDEK